MKNRALQIIFILIFLYFNSIITSCQSDKFIGGIFINANGIHIDGEDESYWHSSSGSIWGAGGISGGVNVKRFLNKSIFYNLEIRYIQKGSVFTYLNQYGTESYELLRLNYIEIPVQLGVMFKRNKRDIMLETGIGYARLLNVNLRMDNFIDRDAYPDVDKFKKQDISWIASFKFPLNQKGKKNILFGLRYSYSLFTVHQSYKIRNMVYGIQLNYEFRN